jgi:zinc/manganese transport system permease protein
LFVVTVAVAIGMGLLGNSGRADDVVIGSVFVWLLGLGALFLTIYTASRSGNGANGAAGVSVLFGSIFGLSPGGALLAAVLSTCVAFATIVLARPLLFATIDAGVAAARGVPVRAIGLAFLGLVGFAAAATTQAVGALLLLGLLAAPAAAAQRLTTHPFRALALSSLLAVLVVWIGLTLSYEVPRVPPSFAIVSIAATVHALSHLVSGRRSRPRQPGTILSHSQS